MAAGVASGVAGAAAVAALSPPTSDARVEVRPWPGAPDVDLVTVTVALPDGGSFVLQRLVRVR